MSDWFNQTIYYFHVPLFFICSGFLYQKFSNVSSWPSWIRNIKKKLLALGVPYFVFSTITWLLKVIFSGSVNTDVNSLWYDLFVHPLSPYWYLYTLFFMFLIVPTINKKSWCVFALLITAVVKMICSSHIYILSAIAGNAVWFVMGMSICLFELDQKMKMSSKYIHILLLAIFLAGSIFAWKFQLDNKVTSFALGLIACVAVLNVALCFSRRHNKLAEYTMPIFLMHTIFAAGIRSVLFKIGIESAYVHIPIGLIASFLGPIIASEIMKRMKLDFLWNPWKYIRVS